MLNRFQFLLLNFNLRRYSKELGKAHERSREAWRENKAGGRPKRNLKFLCEWYQACPGLEGKVMCLAWQHRVGRRRLKRVETTVESAWC